MDFMGDENKWGDRFVLIEFKKCILYMSTI